MPSIIKRSRRSSLAMLILSLASVVLLVGFVNVVIDELRPTPPVIFGTTFSPSYATSLGLDWRETYIAALDDLQIRLLRIPAYWEDVEPNRGSYHFSDLDWMLEEASKRNAKVVLAIGFRLPRWPECHAPAWAHELSDQKRQEETLILLRTTVLRYKHDPAIIAWQVENEPLLTIFGNCPTPNVDFLKQEVALVRSLDRRPIIVTASGELSTWLTPAQISDVLGISMYRVSWNAYLGYLYYPLSPGFYRQRVNAIRGATKKVIVTELQAEPWVPQGILNTPLEEQFQSMNPSKLKDNVSFVRKSGFNDVYLWGVEWWYWLKVKKNDPSMWDLGRSLYKESGSPPLSY